MDRFFTTNFKGKAQTSILNTKKYVVDNNGDERTASCFYRPLQNSTVEKEYLVENALRNGYMR